MERPSVSRRRMSPLLLATALVVALQATRPAAADTPGSSFPWCRCARTSFDTPFIIQDVNMTETSTTRQYTFTFGTQGCLITSPCCDMDLNKLAFHARDNCNASMVAKVVVRTIRVDYSVVTSEHSIQFRSYGKGQIMFKVANMRWRYPDAEDSTVTISLVKGTACDTLDKLLVNHKYSLIDKATKCCPTFTFPEPEATQ